MNETLTQREEQAQDFIMKQFMPALHTVLSKASLAKYLYWGKNCCRQAAVFGTVYLNELLPEYKWYVYDGEFEDVIDGKEVEYNHAWIYGVDWKNKRRLFVDPSRQHKENLFIVVEENEYPDWHPDYKHIKVKKSNKVKINERMKEKEYYTGLKGNKVIEQINQEINQKGEVN